MKLVSMALELELKLKQNFEHMMVLKPKSGREKLLNLKKQTFPEILLKCRTTTEKVIHKLLMLGDKMKEIRCIVEEVTLRLANPVY